MEISKIGQYISVACIAILMLLSFSLYQMYEVKSAEVEKLELEKAILQENEKNLLLNIERQNQAIKELSIKESLVDTSKIVEIFVKDDTCESKLQAYQNLFKILGE